MRPSPTLRSSKYWGFFQCARELILVCLLRREAARRGGGAFVAPVQRVSDFMARRTSSGELPSSSYRLGVRSAPLHDLYSAAITDALQAALLRFDRQMPGFIDNDALLHGVETRTSSPCSIGDCCPHDALAILLLMPRQCDAGLCSICRRSPVVSHRAQALS